MTTPNDQSKPDTTHTPAAGADKPRIIMVDVPHGTSMVQALGGQLIDLSAGSHVAIDPLKLPVGDQDPISLHSFSVAVGAQPGASAAAAGQLPAADSASAPAESTTPFVEPEPGAGSPGSTVFNGLPSPIVCVEIDLLTGQAVRVTPQESVEQLRSFAGAVRAVAPPHHLVLEHPPAADPLTQELADQQIEFSRGRTHLPKVDKNEPPAFI